MKNHGIEELFLSAHKKLLVVNRHYFLVKIAQSILHILLYTAIILILFSVSDMLFDLNVPVRISYWTVVLIIFGYFLVKKIIPNFLCAFRPKQNDLYHISKKIGKNNREVQDSLINFLQIYRDQGITVQPAFKILSLKQLYQKFRDSNFFSIISFHTLRISTYRLLIVGGVFLLLFVIFPASMSQAVLKIIYPTTTFEQPLPVILKNLTGNLSVLKNEAAQLRGIYEGLTPRKVWLVIKSELDGKGNDTEERLEIPINAGNSFSYEINHVKNNFSYWFETRVELAAFNNRTARSQTGIVRVKDRPFIRELQAKLSYPPYTRLPDIFLPVNNGEVTALKGTRVDIDIETNKKLAKAWIRFQNTAEVGLTIRENRSHGSFRVDTDEQYQIMVVDNDSISNYQPVKYSVFSLSDEFPYIEIAKPGLDIDLGNELRIPLLMNLRDDFGFSKLTLKGRHIRNGSTGDTVNFQFSLSYQAIDQNRAISEFDWDLSSFYLIPEDYIEYFAEIADNDMITGPKTSRSKTYLFRLPSIIETLQKAEEALTDQLKDTEDISQATKELKEKLEEINQEMKREDELTWERKQEIQQQLDKQNESMEKLSDVQKELEELVKSLDEQNMLSPETLEKYFELQKMLQELATPELLEAMEELQRAMEELKLEELKQAMEKFTLSMDEFEKRVERIYELFKQIQLEQKMDDLVQLAQKIAEEQQEINQQLKDKNLNQAQQEQLANQENNIEKNTDFFEQKLEEAKQEFQESQAEVASDLDKIQEYLENQQMQQQMQEMQQQMQRGQVQQAQQAGKQLERQLEQMQSMMQQVQQNMNNMQMQELMLAMQKVHQDLLRSSFRQEQLLEKSKNTDVASSQIKEIARKQSQLSENARRINQQMMGIAKQTFFISPQMNGIMTSLEQDMSDAMKSLENRNPRNAARSQQKAMSNLNRAIMSMQNSMNQLSQSSSASGFQEFMQQMQKMAGQQGQLNQESMSLFQQQGQGKRKPSPQSLAQLAARQEMIRQSLENLNKQHGRQENVLGRLGELGQEMKKIIDDLQKQKLDPVVINRQQKILSRMLDAQKSVREREHSKKRQAEKGKNIISKSPPELKQELLERENQLRKDMLNSLKEGYSSEYKEFIKLYYELLSRKAPVNSN